MTNMTIFVVVMVILIIATTIAAIANIFGKKKQLFALDVLEIILTIIAVFF